MMETFFNVSRHFRSCEASAPQPPAEYWNLSYKYDIYLRREPGRQQLLSLSPFLSVPTPFTITN